MAGEASPFQRHAGPTIDEIVQEFGPTHGETTVRSYVTGVFAVNTCGAGIDPNEGKRIVECMRHTAEVVTTELHVLPGGDVEDLVDMKTRRALLRDEDLTNAVFGAFQTLWPLGRDTVLRG
jgi:hypothetical protein